MHHASHAVHPLKYSLPHSLSSCHLNTHTLPQVAGLPPVTKEWFEARKAQLTSAAAAPHTKVWYDPLTKKKFMTQQTYQVGWIVLVRVLVCLLWVVVRA